MIHLELYNHRYTHTYINTGSTCAAFSNVKIKFDLPSSGE